MVFVDHQVCSSNKLFLTLDSTLTAAQSVSLVSVKTLQTDHPGRFSTCSTSQVAMFVGRISVQL